MLGARLLELYNTILELWKKTKCFRVRNRRSKKLKCFLCNFSDYAAHCEAVHASRDNLSPACFCQREEWRRPGSPPDFKLQKAPQSTSGLRPFARRPIVRVSHERDAHGVLPGGGFTMVLAIGICHVMLCKCSLCKRRPVRTSR